MAHWFLVVLSLQTCFAFAQGQFMIQTDRFSQPPFAIRCSQLDSEMARNNQNCGSQFPFVSIENVRLTFGNTIFELCNHSRYEMSLELNKMLNYLDNTCPMSPEANSDPYRMDQAVQQYYDSYNRHCRPATVLPPITAFGTLIIVKCIPELATPRPTTDAPASSTTSSGDQSTSTPPTTTMPTTASYYVSTAETSPPIAATSTLVEQVTTTATSTQKTAPAASTTLNAIVTSVESTTVNKNTERSTSYPGADGDEEQIGGLSRDLFIAVMVLVGLAALTFLLTLIFLAYRGRRKRRAHDKESVIYPWVNGGGGYGEALRLERRDSAYCFIGPDKANGSIFAPSTIGDAESLRRIRSPSLTPSLLVPLDADSVVALHVNGESRPFVAVPLDAASRAVRGRGSRSSSLSDFETALESSSICSVESAPAAATTTNAPALSRYRSLFTRRRSLSAPEELDNATFERDYDAQAPWSSGGGKRGPRPARTATLSSVGRLESIGEELSSIDSAVTAGRYDADGDDDYANRGARQAAGARRLSQMPLAAGRRRPSRQDKAAAIRTIDAAIGTEPAFGRPGASSQGRRMTLPNLSGAYYEAAPASPSSPPLSPLQSTEPRYSADGRSFTQDGASFKGTVDEDGSDAESPSSVGTPTRWPYASRLRLPRTSWSGASGGDGSGGAGRPLALPVKKHGWPERLLSRRQSAL